MGLARRVRAPTAPVRPVARARLALLARAGLANRALAARVRQQSGQV
ncbi:MAG TPA: hypothetical protein VFW96_23175 [Thermomicrobiales bacterium]|nr:hypothetical protein [Thermomicrobiales bacterium]